MAKLKKARRKEQYLRIQASYLSKKEPVVALFLLDKYFELEDDFDHAQAYCDKAEALISLGEVDEALESYKQALKRESEFPKLLTEAYIHFSLSVANFRASKYYVEANEILEKNQGRSLFPVDVFRWHAAKAILELENGNKEEAAKHAGLALDAAEIKKSGFRFHQKTGLVGKKYESLVKQLRKIYA